jgi:glycosyltransferase involved in cell wall biosynthesis
MLKRTFNIASICRTLPTPEDPSAGVFVLNRLRAMQRIADVSIVQPVPFMPIVRPLPRWAKASSHRVGESEIQHAPMFYVPGLFKTLDATWLVRAIEGPLRRLHERAPLDLVDAHFAYPDGAGAVKVARRLGVPAFITIRGFEAEYLQIPGIREQILSALHGAAGCIAVSQSLRDLVVGEGLPADKVEVIQNAVDFENFAWRPQSEARRRLGVDQDARLIVCVGHLIARKRQHVLLEAFRAARGRLPGLKLVLIGAPTAEPDYARKVTGIARSADLADSVTVAGVVPPPGVAHWLQASDLFVLPTAREGCCNAILEALAVGVPVVTTPVGDNARFIKPGLDGELVPVDDAIALEEAIVRTLSRRDWDRPAIANRLVESVGAWHSVAERVLEFMRHQLQGAGQRGQ